MSESQQLGEAEVQEARDVLTAIRTELRKLFVGQEELIDGSIAAIVADGHVLVESLPGLGKTLLVKALARVLGLTTSRIQFTPDLMPSDITGTHVFDPGEKRFSFHPGPVFTQFLLADEINRAPAKTHAALLEVMQERQVTVDGRRHAMASPFLVMATQNPIENEGTYQLPEAGLDRFLFKLTITYPSAEEEEKILGLFLQGSSPERILAESIEPVTTPERVIDLQRLAARVFVDPKIVSYITQIVRSTRGAAGLYLGASPRAAIAILTGARAKAIERGRTFVVPDDAMDIALAALRHRVILSPESEIEGKTTDSILVELLRDVPVPRL